MKGQKKKSFLNEFVERWTYYLVDVVESLGVYLMLVKVERVGGELG